MRLIVPELTLFRKKNQGTRPAYAKIGYGTPSPEMFPRRENTNVNTAIVASGWMIAQPKPKSDWLYRPLTSRFVRLTSSSQYADAPTRSARSESAGTAAGIVDTVVAVIQVAPSF